MAHGSEYLTSNTKIAYPFREDALGLAYTADPAHGIGATIPTDLMADALIEVPETVTDLYLRQIAASGGGLYTLLFVDQYLNTVINAAVNTGGWTTSQFYQVVTLQGLADGVIAKLVLPTEAFLAFVSGIVGTDEFQNRLPVASHVLNPLIPSVKSFELYTELPDPPEPDVPGPISGHVKFMSGYNIDQVVNTPEDELDTTEIVITAVGGAGEGVAPCQHGGSTIYRNFMELVPDENGDIRIAPGPDNCYVIVPHVDSEMLEIQGTCEACCTCDDYVNVAKALENLLDRAKTIYCELRYAHDGPSAAGTGGCTEPPQPAEDHSYTRGVKHFNTIVSGRYHKPAMEATGYGGADWGGDPDIRSGAAHWVTIMLKFRNNTEYDCVLQSADLNLFTPGSYRIRQATWEYNGEGDQLPALGNLSAIPTVPRGYSAIIYVLAYAKFPQDPVWEGDPRLTVEVQSTPPNTVVIEDHLKVD